MSELSTSLLARDSEIIRLETQILFLASQLKKQRVKETTASVQTECFENSSSSFGQGKYIQKIMELENKLIESDSKNLQLDKIIRNLYGIIESSLSKKSENSTLSDRKNTSSTSTLPSSNKTQILSKKPSRPPSSLLKKRVPRVSSESRLS